MNSQVQIEHRDLIAQIYESVMDQNGFQQFIDKLEQDFKLKSVTMVIRHSMTHDVKGLWLTGITQEWQQKYVLEYAKDDMLARHIMISPIANFYASNIDLQHLDNFMETAFFKEWIIPQGIMCAAGAVIVNEDNWLTQIIVQRGFEHPPFTQDELSQLNLLIPHLQRATQMRQRFIELQVGQNFLVGGLDVLAMPTFLLDESGMVAHSNESAKNLLKSQTHLWLHNTYLRTDNSDITRQLNVEIFNAIEVSRGKDIELNNVILLPRVGIMPLMLLISPVHRAGSPAPLGGALLFAFDPLTTPQITVDLVCQLFSLSKGEAKLAIALCEGKTLEDIATTHGTSIHTIKTQLKNAFLKTGTKRQSELVSLLLASPAYFLTVK